MAPPKRTDEEKALAQVVGARIRKCREHRKLKVPQLAVAAGIDPDHLRALEKGSHVAYDHTLNRIAAALGTSTAFLKTGKKR